MDKQKLIDDAMGRVTEYGTVGAMRWLAEALLEQRTATAVQMPDHPDPHSMAWTDRERYVIAVYGNARAEEARREAAARITEMEEKVKLYALCMNTGGVDKLHARVTELEAANADLLGVYHSAGARHVEEIKTLTGQRTAGGDVHLPGCGLESSREFSSCACFLGQPVAEAAAQADDVGDVHNLAYFDRAFAAAPTAQPTPVKIPGLGRITNEDDGFYTLQFVNEDVGQRFMEQYAPSVDVDDMPDVTPKWEQAQSTPGAEQRLQAMYAAVGRVVNGEKELNITRLYDYLGREEGMPANAVLCDVEEAQPTPPDDERAAFEAWAKEDRPFDEIRFPGVAGWAAWQKRSEQCEARVADLLMQLDQKEEARSRLATALESANARAALRQTGALGDGGRRIKDHEIAQLVNTLRDTAIEFHDTQQLRERIASVLVPVLRAARTEPKEP